ncbi:hypothetical protein HDU93_003188, partial [Gonapodya sp. JEL0774]
VQSAGSDSASTYLNFLGGDPNLVTLGLPSSVGETLVDVPMETHGAPKADQFTLVGNPALGLGFPTDMMTISQELGMQNLEEAAADEVYRAVWRTFSAAAQNGVVGRIKPARGPCDGGTLVTIEGSGFTDSAVVHFGSTIIPTQLILRISDSSLSVVSPPSATPGSVSILVYNLGGAQVCHGKAEFTYYDYQGNVDPLITRIRQLEDELERTKVELVEERKERMNWVGMLLRYNDRGNLALHEAVEASDYAGMKAILEMAAEIAGGHEDFGEIAKTFEVDPANMVDAITKEGKTALMIAVGLGNAEAVEILIQAGAKIDLEVNGETALDMARMLAHTEIVDLLTRSASIIASSPKSTIHRRTMPEIRDLESLKQRALQEQDVDAMLELAHLYETGTAPNIVKNPRQAFAWSLAAVQTGDIEAQLLFARYLEQGFGFKRSLDLALALYSTLSKAGCEVAEDKRRLLQESMHLSGEDVPESSSSESVLSDTENENVQTLPSGSEAVSKALPS